jgi:hypothetical protein
MRCGHEVASVTHLRKLMLEELERRNYAGTIEVRDLQMGHRWHKARLAGR